MGPEAAAVPIRALRFLPVGALPPGLLQGIVGRVSAALPLPCRMERPAVAEEWEFPLLEGRNQTDADRLLALLEERATEPGVILCGITAQDIGDPIFAYFFGRARLGGRAVLVSVARLAPRFHGLPDDLDLTLRRAAHEVLHELGHIGGLRHCEDYACVMRFAPTVDAVDLRGATYCAGCAAAMPEPLRPRG
jgi:archaemetzincin